MESRFPYPDRPGVNLQPATESIRNPNHLELSAEERADVFVFEQSLTSSEKPLGKVEDVDGTDLEVTGLEQAWRYTVNTSDFYIEYFLSNDCIDDLEVLGIKDRSFTTTSEVIAALYSIDYAKIDAKELKKSQETVNLLQKIE